MRDGSTRAWASAAQGRTLKVIVPDSGPYLDLYQKSLAGYQVTFPYLEEVGQRDLDENSRYGFTPMMAINRIFRGYSHRFAYDAETVEGPLAQVGFIYITRRE